MFGKDNKDKSEKKESIITRETIGFTLAVFSALILIVLFTGRLIFGDLGESVSNFFFGVFGFMSYFVFAGLLYLAITLIAGRNFIPNLSMTISLFVCVALVGLLVHAILTSNIANATYGEYLGSCFAMGNKGVFACTPFGWFGGLITYPFMALATPAGAYILLTAGIGLTGYLFVNAVLIYTGIRPTTNRVKATETRRETEQTTPLTFEDIQNDRTAQVATPVTSQPTVAPAYFSEREVPLVDERRSGVNVGVNSYTSPIVGRELLYGETQQGDYRSRNLIFDEASQYNNRPAAPSYYAPETRDTTDVNDTNGYGEQSYIATYSQEVDGRSNASEQPREVLKENQSSPVRGGYSPYRENVYGQYDAVTTESQFEERDDLSPTPSYRAPSLRVDAPASSLAPQEHVVSNENQAVERSERNLRDVFGADRELQSRQSAQSVQSTTTEDEEIETEEREVSIPNDTQTDRIEKIHSFMEDRSGIFDEDEEEIEEEVTLEDEPAGRSRDALSSTMRDFPRSSTINSDRGTPPTRDRVVSFDGQSVSSERRVPTVMPSGTTSPATLPPKPRVIREYQRPSTALLDVYPDAVSVSEDEIKTNKEGIVKTLDGFGIAVEVVNVTTGPALTRYDITFPSNVTVRTIARYADSIAMCLRVKNPVKITSNFSYGTIAIEVPNRKVATVGLRSLLESEAFIDARPNTLTFCIGKDVEGKAVCKNLCATPHMLVAGTTGSGKSVFLHEMIMSLIMRYSPEEVRLVLVDPKQTEFAGYEGIPHLLINEIITAAPKLIVTLNYLINEMEKRNTLFRQMSAKGKLVRGIDEYNAAVDKKEDKLPKIILIADEVADMMSVAKKDIEDRISRLAAKARSAGIHLVLATQRPSTDVFTGVLKANLPSRFALRVGAEVDSRVIMDDSGAEKLLGRGDLLYKMGDMFAPERVQAAWVSPDETQRVCDFIRKNNEAYFEESIVDFIENGGKTPSERAAEEGGDGEIEPVYIDALRYVVKTNSASISMIQRKCSVGYNKAGKIIEWMEISGYISPFDGAKSRKVLISAEEFEAKFGEL